MALIDKFREFASRPLPQRLSAQDTNEYIQPQPSWDPQQYLTYWTGNQLPGYFIHTANPIQMWTSVKDKQVLFQSSPYGAQRTSGSFNYNLSQQNSQQVIATWRTAWSNLAAAQSGAH